MTNSRTLAVILLNLAILMACATKGPIDIGMELNRDGKYAEAIEQFTQVIQTTRYDNELYLSYYHRAEAYKATGSPRKAFHDYYASKLISCYLTKIDKNTGSYAKGGIAENYCNLWANEKMASVSHDISIADQNAIKQRVETLMQKYLTTAK